MYFSIDINKIASQAAGLLEIRKYVIDAKACIQDIRVDLSEICINGLSGALDQLENSVDAREKDLNSMSNRLLDVVNTYRDLELLEKCKNGEALTPNDISYLRQYYSILCLARYGGGKDINSLKDDPSYRDELIIVFESLYPDETKKTNKLLNGMANDPSGKYVEDVANIKYIIYTSDEPYSSLFFKNVDKFSIKEYDYNGTQYYDPKNKKVYVKLIQGKNDKEDEYGDKDPRGPYVSFFHEIGHAVDDAMAKDTDKDILRATIEDSNKLYNTAEGDVRNRLLIEIEKADGEKPAINLTKDQKESILKNIMNPDFEYDDWEAGSDEKIIFDKMEENMKKDIGNGRNNGISDTYEGYTNGSIKPGWGHISNSPNYWFKESGESTYSQTSELWAHYFSRNMLGDSDALNGYQNDYFPNASKYMDEMAIRYLTEENLIV